MAGKENRPDASPGIAGLLALIAKTKQDRLLPFPASSHASDQGGACHLSRGSLPVLTPADDSLSKGSYLVGLLVLLDTHVSQLPQSPQLGLGPHDRHSDEGIRVPAHAGGERHHLPATVQGLLRRLQWQRAVRLSWCGSSRCLVGAAGAGRWPQLMPRSATCSMLCASWGQQTGLVGSRAGRGKLSGCRRARQ